jgi:hypothetical protein
MEDKNLKDNSQNNNGNNTDNMANIIDIPKGVHAKKSEKICAAIFLISGFLNDQEPLKWDIRRIASKLVSVSARLHFIDYQNRKQTVSDCKTTISELSSLLEVASLAGLISSMNASVLAKELDSLLSIVDKDENNAGKAGQIKFSKNFFDVPETLMLGSQNINEFTYPKNEISIARNIKDNSNFGDFNVKKTNHLQDQKNHNVAREYGSVAIKRNKRQSFIIQILKKKKDLTIKDISTIFHDCSEKTIQRELALLVGDGVVVREGERRWTKYSLALGV